MKGVKTGGRTIGTPNKINTEIKEAIKLVFESELSDLTPHLKTMPIKERLDFLTKLLPYIMPKPDQGSNVFNAQINWNETKSYEPPQILLQIDSKDICLK